MVICEVNLQILERAASAARPLASKKLKQVVGLSLSQL